MSQNQNPDKEINKLENFLKPYLGFNTENLYENRFVEDYFSTIFERIGAIKILYKFRAFDPKTDDKTEYWEHISNFCINLGNLVYKHEGLLSSIDVYSMQAHWGYPIYPKISLPQSLFNFAIEAARIFETKTFLDYSIVMFIGQAYVSSIGPRANQKYCATPELFLNLPEFSKLPTGICADKKTREIILDEVGNKYNESHVIRQLNFDE